MNEMLAIVGPVSLMVTKLVDLIRNAIDPNDTVPKTWWNVASFGLGIAVASVWHINAAVSMLPADSQLQDWGGIVLTGLVVGAVASGWHELLDALSSVAKRGK
jgi:hypothetical protein